jgi:DNA-directed RNA polymerase specialized sigma24 family protein
VKVRPKLNLKLYSHERIPPSRASADKRRSSYIRASQYRRLLHSVAHRVLGNPDRADIAVENCLFSASNRATAFDCEGAFRSWLVRLAIDEALAILHGSSIPEHWSLQGPGQPVAEGIARVDLGSRGSASVVRPSQI